MTKGLVQGPLSPQDGLSELGSLPHGTRHRPRGLFLLFIIVLTSSQVTVYTRLFLRPCVATKALCSG